MQLAAEAGLRDGRVAVGGEEVLQQRYGPVHGLVTPMSGPLLKRQAEQVREVGRPHRGATRPRRVGEDARVRVAAEDVQPVVDALAGHPQGVGDLGDGGAGIDL
jgi:hypothetical protein